MERGGLCFFLQGEAAPKVLCAGVINDEFGVESENMVYCTKCGTNNVEGAKVCVNCGAPLYGAGVPAGLTWGVCGMRESITVAWEPVPSPA